MKNYTKQYLKGILRDYPLLDERINERRESLLTPDVRELDENIGGGSGSRVGDPVGIIASKITDDETLKTYIHHKQAIETTLNQFDKHVKNIVALRYFEQMSQDDVSQKLGLTVAIVRTGENAFLKKLAKRLNLMR